VHEAVIAGSDRETGITIHYVDEQYDHGEPIFQARVSVEPGDDPGTLARKVQALEYEYFPEVIEQVVKSVKPIHRNH
jgi:phosphoribosylglycinamide formyltransferase 1